MNAIVALKRAKEYTDSVILGDALVGKNVTISSIIPIDGGNRVTFSYTLDDGTTETSALDVMNGTTPHIGNNGNWFLDEFDTGVLASPDVGGFYNETNLLAMSTDEINEICKL